MNILKCSELRITRLLTSALLMLLLATNAFSETVATEQTSQGALSESTATATKLTTTTVYLVRHAEKHLDQGRDPELTEAGATRSKRWADVFSNQTLDNVYSTNTKRTLSTALPIAESQNTQVKLMEAMPTNLPELISTHQGKSILMVGHSNTLPSLVNAMIGEERYSDLDESNYSTLFIVTINGDSANAQQLKISL